MIVYNFHPGWVVSAFSAIGGRTREVLLTDYNDLA